MNRRTVDRHSNSEDGGISYSVILRWAMGIAAGLCLSVLVSVGSGYVALKISNATTEQAVQNNILNIKGIVQKLENLTSSVQMNTNALGDLDGTLRELRVQIQAASDAFKVGLTSITARQDKPEIAFNSFRDNISNQLQDVNVSVATLKKSQETLEETVHELKMREELIRIRRALESEGAFGEEGSDIGGRRSG